MEAVWIVYDRRTEYEWSMYGNMQHIIGICMEYMWNRYGICLEYVRNMYGMFMEYVKNMYGTCMEYVGACMEYE